MELNASTLKLIRLALQEDLGIRGDITTLNILPATTRIAAHIVAKQDGIICGLDIVGAVFKIVSPRIHFTPLTQDGRRVRKGQKIARLRGPRAVLTAERTALNFLQHLSGIATLTRRYADELKGTKARLYDTRKTLPGWRALEKHAVSCGGGYNHRMGLYDTVMIKDNHQDIIASGGPHGAPGRCRGRPSTRPHAGVFPTAITDTLRRLRRHDSKLPIIVEAKTGAQIHWALQCRADIILLDNMPLSRLRGAIAFIRRQSPRTQIEVSGGVRLDNIRAIARLAPDRISVGRITHSAPALDFSLECHG